MREPNEQQVNLTRLTGTQEEMRAMPSLGQHTHAGTDDKTESKQNENKQNCDRDHKNVLYNVMAIARKG